MKFSKLGILAYVLCVMFMIFTITDRLGLRVITTLFVFIAGAMVGIMDIIDIRRNEVIEHEKKKDIL